MVKNKKDLLSPRRTKSLRKNVCISNSGRGSANFRVLVRIRPQSNKEIEQNQKKIVKIVDNVVVFDPKEEEEPFFYQGVQQPLRDLNKRVNKNINFTFDTVFGPTVTNYDVFVKSTKPLIDTLMDGYNCSVFVYGATGAGKTHTMIGHSESPGITFLTMKELFDKIDTYKDKKNFELGMTYLEVYNETVKDLLNPGEPLHLREDAKVGVCVAGLTMKKINNPIELFELLKQGNSNRTQHPTDANAESSRSHAVFQVYINMTDRLTSERRVAKLSMIDLAGSERGAATGCTGMRFTEGANINKSLLALGNCINSLADGARHVPYRDSKLTRLLKDSLGGNCQTIMIANISPSWGNYEDTYNTLRYALRAKKIKTSNVKRNVIKNDLSVMQYKKIVEDLNAQIEELKQKNSELETKLSQSSTVVQKTQVQNTVCIKCIGSPKISKILPEIVVESPEILGPEDQNFNNIYDELRTVQRQILRLQGDEKMLELKQKFKESTENKLRALCEANETFDKVKSRLQTTVDAFQQKISSIKCQLKDLTDYRQKIDTNLTVCVKNGFTELEKNLRIDFLTEKLKSDEKIFEIFEEEIDFRDRIEQKMSESLNNYFKILNGYGYLTDGLRNDYEGLKNLIQGLRNVHWGSNVIFENENSDKNMSSAIIPILKNTVSQESIGDSFRSSKIRCRLYSENDLTPQKSDMEIIFNSDRKNNLSTNLDETFNLTDVKIDRTFQLPRGTNGTPKKFKKDQNFHLLGTQVHSNSKFLGQKNKENKIAKKNFPVMDRTQKFALRQNNLTNSGASRTIVKKNTRPVRTPVKLDTKDSKNLKYKNKLAFMKDNVKFKQ